MSVTYFTYLLFLVISPAYGPTGAPWLPDDVTTIEDESGLGLEGRQGALSFLLGLTVWHRSAKLVIFGSHLLTNCWC